jgi:hypothetical protein
VKRSGRDEPVWVLLHMYVEAMLGISLSQTSKYDMSFLLSLLSSLQQNWRRGQNRFSWKQGGWEEEEGGGREPGEKWPKHCMHI